MPAGGEASLFCNGDRKATLYKETKQTVIFTHIHGSWALGPGCKEHLLPTPCNPSKIMSKKKCSPLKNLVSLCAMRRAHRPLIWKFWVCCADVVSEIAKGHAELRRELLLLPVFRRFFTSSLRYFALSLVPDGSAECNRMVPEVLLKS